MTQAQRRAFLIQSLLKERAEYRDIGIPSGEADQRTLLRGLMNLRPALEKEIRYNKLRKLKKGKRDMVCRTLVE